MGYYTLCNSPIDLLISASGLMGGTLILKKFSKWRCDTLVSSHSLYANCVFVCFQGNPITCTAVSGDRRWLVMADVGKDPILTVWDSFSGSVLQRGTCNQEDVYVCSCVCSLLEVVQAL